jgi:protein-S-isoprenylcysteine O-methyltransferase Ste14
MRREFATLHKLFLRVIGALAIALLASIAATLDAGLRLSIGLVAGIPSFVLMIIGRHQLGDAFAVMPEARTLVTKGLYAVIQHPMYLFLDLFLAAVIVAFGIPWIVSLWGVLVAVQLLQSTREERILASTFGEAYRVYTAKTWI